MKLTQFIKTGVVAAVIATAALGLAHVATAQTNNEQSQTANTLRVSPVRSDVTVNPGDTSIINVTVSNPSDAKVTVRPIQNDFVAGDEDGTPAIILEEGESADSHSLKQFLSPLETVEIEPGESKTVEVEVTIPEDAEAGGYYGVIRFAPSTPDDGGEVNTSASVASIVLLTVTGDAAEKLDLTEFLVKQHDRVKSFFTSGDGVSTAIRFQNDGQVHAGPFGAITVTKGDTIVQEIDFNNKTQRDMVLPDSARRWSVPLEGIDGFGKYTVHATFTYGASNKSIEASESFWVIPKMIIVLFAAASLVIVAVIGAVIYRLRGTKGSVKKSTKRRR